MASITVAVGNRRVRVENDDNDSIADFIARRGDELGIGLSQTPMLDGEAVDFDTPIGDAEELAFGKPVGQKGTHRW